MNNTLKPNGISHTVMPTDKPSCYNAWMRLITNTTVPAYRWQMQNNGQTSPV